MKIMHWIRCLNFFNLKFCFYYRFIWISPAEMISLNNFGSRQLFRVIIFPDEYVVIAFQRLYLNYSPNFGTLPKKPQISCPLRGNISPKKMTGAQQKICRGPQNLGKFVPPPLSAALDQVQKFNGYSVWYKTIIQWQCWRTLVHSLCWYHICWF
jgi:hypothetical protein